MTKNEVREMAEKMVNERAETAFNTMNGFKRIEGIYNDLAKMGYVDVAKCIKSLTFWHMMLNPNDTEDDVLLVLFERVMKSSNN